MERLKIKISEIKDLCDTKREIHSKMLDAGLNSIDFIDDNNDVIKIDQQNIDDFIYTGLNLIDFIDSDFYIYGFSKE